MIPTCCTSHRSIKKSVFTLILSAALLLSGSWVRAQSAQAEVVHAESLAESIAKPSGKFLHVAGNNPARGNGNFKVYLMFPIVTGGLMPGDYTLNLDGYFEQRPSSISIGMRGINSTSESTFLNALYQSEAVPEELMQAWKRVSVPIQVRNASWEGSMEIECNLFGNTRDQPAEMSFWLTNISLTNRAGEQLLKAGKVTFENDMSGEPPSSIAAKCDRAEEQDGACSMLVSEEAP